jgi:hypothetical protein
MKQTAVNYLYQHFIILLIEFAEDKIDYEKFGQLMTIAKDAAKNIEQFQIEQSYNDGNSEWNEVEYKNGEHYYKQKYGQ